MINVEGMDTIASAYHELKCWCHPMSMSININVCQCQHPLPHNKYWGEMDIIMNTYTDIHPLNIEHINELTMQ